MEIEIDNQYKQETIIAHCHILRDEIDPWDGLPVEYNFDFDLKKYVYPYNVDFHLYIHAFEIDGEACSVEVDIGDGEKEVYRKDVIDTKIGKEILEHLKNSFTI